MSNWAFIKGFLILDTNIDNESSLCFVKKLISLAPKITGSEGNAAPCCSIEDSDHIFLQKINKRPYLGCVTVTFCDSLRNRNLRELSNEYRAFKEYLLESIGVEENFYNITKFIFMGDNISNKIICDVDFDENWMFKESGKIIERFLELNKNL